MGEKFISLKIKRRKNVVSHPIVACFCFVLFFVSFNCNRKADNLHSGIVEKYQPTLSQIQGVFFQRNCELLFTKFTKSES